MSTHNLHAMTVCKWTILPADLACYSLGLFLEDRDAHSWACTAKDTLTQMRQFPSTNSVHISEVLSMVAHSVNNQPRWTFGVPTNTWFRVESLEEATDRLDDGRSFHLETIQPILERLPTSIRRIYFFTDRLDTPIQFAIGIRVLEVLLEYSWSHKIRILHLPPLLEELIYTGTFPSEIEFPSTLRVITLSGKIPSFPPEAWPKSLQSLDISDATFQCKTLPPLPEGLERLVCAKGLSSEIFGAGDWMPRSLRFLKGAFAGANLPPNLTDLRLNAEISYANPPTLTEMKDHTSMSQWRPMPILPGAIRTLHLWSEFNEPLDQHSINWPSNLTDLQISCKWNLPCGKITLPKTLTKLRFGDNAKGEFNQPVDTLALPEGLLYLHFGHDFDQPIDQLVLPKTLLTLCFSDFFNHPVDHLCLPSSLTSLQFGSQFNQDISQLVLPPGLQRLFLGFSAKGFKQSLRQIKWPHRLHALAVPMNDVELLPTELPSSLRLLYRWIYEPRLRLSDITDGDDDTDVDDGRQSPEIEPYELRQMEAEAAWEALTARVPRCVSILPRSIHGRQPPEWDG